MLDLLIRPALTDLGAIIVAPDSIDGGWSGPENERAVQTLLEAVLNTYSVDPAEGHRHRLQYGGSGHVALGKQVSGAIQRGDSGGRAPDGIGVSVARAGVCGAFPE